jgi:hypothetical protein
MRRIGRTIIGGLLTAAAGFMAGSVIGFVWDELLDELRHA